MNREILTLAVQLYGGKLSSTYGDIHYVVAGSDAQDDVSSDELLAAAQPRY
jgi:hypothetical protein